MMRANMQGMSGWKGMMLKHGEKIGLAMIGLAVAWFIYSSIGRDSLPPEKPQELKTLVTSASSNIDRTMWDELTQEDKSIAADAKPSSRPMSNIPTEYYRPLGSFDHNIVSIKEPRRDPVLLAVVDLEVYPGAGILPHIDPVEEARRLREEAIKEERREREAEEAREDDAEGGGGRRPGRGTGLSDFVGGRGGGRGMGRDLLDGPRGGGGAMGDNPDVRIIGMTNQMEGFIPNGTERLDLSYWNCVVGKVPIKKQIKEFSKALQNSFNYDPAMDYPHYIVYVVERKEITDSGESKWQRIKPYSPETKRSVPYINKIYLLQLTWDWPTQMEPVVGRQCIDPLLTFPLPPVVGHQWGKDATHSDIPLFNPNDVPQDRQDEAPIQDENAELGEDVFVGGSRGNAMEGMRGRGRTGEMFGRHDSARPSRRMGGVGGFDREGMEFGMPGGGGSRGGMMGGRRGEMGGGFGAAEEAEYLLFRFFDFSVRPGKKYSYRIRLVLDDPNHNKRKHDLATEVLKRRAQVAQGKNAQQMLAVRLTAWSEPSPIVSVPLPGMVLSGEVKPASSQSHTSEPSAQLVLRAFEAPMSEELISDEDRCYRGKVCNVKVSDGWVVAANRRELHRKKNYLVRTGVMLADMSGGEKLDGSRDMTAPGTVLLMSPTGRLIIHDELKDAEDIRFYHRLLLGEEENRSMGAGEMGGRMEGGFLDRFRGGGRER